MVKPGLNGGGGLKKIFLGVVIFPDDDPLNNLAVIYKTANIVIFIISTLKEAPQRMEDSRLAKDVRAYIIFCA